MASTMTTTEAGEGAAAGPPPPPSYHNSTWKLISQGAEARLWQVPDFVSWCGSSSASSSSASSSNKPTTRTRMVACKERFSKSYRHPTLDASLTKSRTKGEAKCLARCRRGGVACPAVLAVDPGRPSSSSSSNSTSSHNDSASSCLFLEWIHGSTLRQYLEERAQEDREIDNNMTGQVDRECENNNEPATKKARTARSKQTRVDKEARLVAQALGRIVADMHNVNIVHGDLTTSNIMMMPPSPPQKEETEKEEDTNKWKPKLVLIDFGLSSTAGSKGVSHEEKAVDLYVLERAFESTHPGSSDLVAEFHRSYKGHSKTSDSVLQRLSQVRMRGRKRDCFG